MRNLFVILFLYIFTSLLYGQEQKCPFNEVNCEGKCGLFRDNNKDGYCDLATLFLSDSVEISTSEKQIVKEKNIPTDTKHLTNKQIVFQEEKTIEEGTVIEKQQSNIQSETTTVQNNEQCIKGKSYHLFPIMVSLLIFYGITVALMKCNIIKKVTHRKIWNIALTVTFLVSGLLGLLLAFFINYSYVPNYYLNIITLHIEFGIAMAVIAVFHFLWHLNYYKVIFKKKKTKIND